MKLYEKYTQQKKSVEYKALAFSLENTGCSLFVLQELYAYYLALDSIFENDPELLNMADGQVLAAEYFESSTLLDPDLYIQKYTPVFEMILNKIRQEKLQQ